MLNELIGSVVQVLVFSLVPFIVWLLTARRKGSFFTWIGLKRPAIGNIKKTVLFTAAAAVLYIGAMAVCIRILPEGVTTAGSQFSGKGPAALPSVIFYAVLRTALSEEILFRGFILKRLQHRFSFAAGNTVQALLFGLLHGFPFGIITKSVWAFLLLTLVPGLMGWYLGWMNEKQCGGSIIPGWLLHGCINILSAVRTL